jgi:hypothetical protein
VELKLHPPEGLSRMMNCAQRIDEKNILMNKRNVGLSSNGKPIRTYNNSSSVTWEFGNKNHESLTWGCKYCG